MRLLLATAAAAAALAVPAHAYPCEGMSVPQCTSPLRYKLEHLCFPPNASDPYGC